MTATQSHRLAALFAPARVAVVGASSREGRPGHQVLRALQRFNPNLDIRPVTPSYGEILGLTCVPDLEDLPEVDLAIIASSHERVVGEAVKLIDRGAKSLLVFGASKPGADRDAWLGRLREISAEANTPLLGPDCLGYVNYTARVGATWALPDDAVTGGICILSQSGTVFWEAITNDPRLQFSFSAHAGLEATLTIADLLDYATSLPQTRVIGVYLETIRDVEALASALASANVKKIPIVALYAGRTPASRAQMLTHAGRMADDLSGVEALCRCYGVAQARTLDEWWTTLALLGGPRQVDTGGVAAVMDSGGGLAMFLDFASELRIPIADIALPTQERIQEILGVSAEVGGALDFWVGDADRHAGTEQVVEALIDDPGTAAVMTFTTYAEAPSAGFAARIADACISVAGRTSKPILAATYTSRQLYPGLMHRLVQERIPVLDGMWTALQAMRHAMDYRDFLIDRASRHPAVPVREGAIDVWKERLRSQGQLNEADALELLDAAGIPCVVARRASNAQQVLEAASQVGYPLVLKTDEGIAHKAQHGGVRLGIADDESLIRAYADMANRLGSRVILAPMYPGLELALGVVRTDVGSTVLIGAGGVLIETLSDRCCLLAPASAADVARAMADLKVTMAIRSKFGEGSSQEKQFHQVVSRVTSLVAELEGHLQELDINPIIIGDHGPIAVDALAVVQS